MVADEALRWMALTRCTRVELEHTVNHILTNFGGQFKMAS